MGSINESGGSIIGDALKNALLGVRGRLRLRVNSANQLRTSEATYKRTTPRLARTRGKSFRSASAANCWY